MRDGVAVPARRRAAPTPSRRARRVRRGARVLRHGARAAGGEPATFLLDEFLELRTFESFPGLRRVLRDLVGGARGERQPLRADQPLHGARAAAAARRAGALRSHPRAAADAAEDPLDAAGGPAARTVGSTTTRTTARATSSRALVQALADGRPAYARADRRNRRRRSAPRGAADPVSALAALLAPGRRARRRVPLLLRAAAAPRARLRRAQGDPRHPRRGRAADADRDRAAPAAHAGLDEGLSVVARGRGPDRVAAEALQLRRSAAAPVGAPALPRRRRRPTTTSRARCTRYALARLPQRRARAGAGRRGRRRRRTQKRGESSRSTDQDQESIGLQSLTRLRSLSSSRAPACAAACSASFLLRPSAVGQRLAVRPRLRPRTCLPVVGPDLAGEAVLRQRRGRATAATPAAPTCSPR